MVATFSLPLPLLLLGFLTICCCSTRDLIYVRRQTNLWVGGVTFREIPDLFSCSWQCTMDSASCQFFTYVEDKSECMAGTEDALEAIVLVPNHGVGTYIRQPLLEHISDGCGFGWKRWNSGCYKYYDTPTIWMEAHRSCLGKDARLVSIASREENDFVRGLADIPFWIGLRFFSGTWLWVDASVSPGWFEWAPYEPCNQSLNHCATLNYYPGKTDDAHCKYQYGFVCQKQALFP